TVFLNDDFHAEGEVRMLGAQIGGDLDCTRGAFENPSGDALSADRSSVAGDVILREGFHAKGDIRLVGVQIGGNLDCTNSKLTKLTAKSASIKGNILWVDLRNAASAELDLRNASVGSMGDDSDEEKWPQHLL